MKNKLASIVRVAMLVSAGLLLFFGNVVAETGTCARVAPGSDTQLYICRYVNRR